MRLLDSERGVLMEQSILDLDKQLCFRLYSVSRKMTKAYQPLLEKYQLTYPQYIVMLGVFEDDTIDFKKLSKKINLKTATLTPIVQKLESLGYIERQKNVDDFRKMNVVLTKKGKELNMNIIDVPIGLAKKLQLSIDKYETLVKELDDLDEILTDTLGSKK